jgi:hypothetical protein
MILWTAKRLSHPERLTFLRECVLNATDDTMAFNLLRILTNQKDDLDLKVTATDLYSSFAERMRKRYGRDVDATNIDLSTSDPWAFDYWGRDLTTHGFPTDPEDRKIQNEFWLRYIGNSRARLAEAFRGFFFPVAVYSEDPATAVKHKIDLEDLKRLYESLPEPADLTDRDKKSLDLLRRLLNGEFKNGVDPMLKIMAVRQCVGAFIGTLINLSNVTGFLAPELMLFSRPRHMNSVPFASTLRRIVNYFV